jgi:tetratricopeptide (TPR) repeat protein
MRRILTGLVLMLVALPASAQSNRNEGEKGNAISPETIEALTTDYFSRGNAYYDKGLYDQAIADYTKAIEWSPVNADVYFNRGVAYSQERLYDQAIADFTKVIALKPDDANVYNQRAWNYHLKGEDAKGLPDANKAVALAPNDTANIETRAEIYEKLRQRDNAIAD